MRRGAFDFYVAISGSAEKASEAKNTMEFSRPTGGKNYALKEPDFLKNLAVFPEGLFCVERSALPLRQ